MTSLRSIAVRFLPDFLRKFIKSLLGKKDLAYLLPLTPEAVTWGYRLLLDREPENHRVVEDKIRRLANNQELRQEFLHSEEYKSRNPILTSPTLAGNEPPMSIEEGDSTADLQILFAHVQDVWQHLGETEPYWSVLTSKSFLQAHISGNIDMFYNTGKDNVAYLFSALDRNGINYTGFKSCLEYGCGLGRVTRWLGERFEQVHAYDISKAHLNVAENYFGEHGINNVTLHHIQQVKDIEDLPKVDLVYSLIVLQHNPPPLIGLIIREFIRALKPGGVAFFQLPTYRLGYHFSLERYVHEEQTRREMEMHVLPQRMVFEIIRQEGGRVVEVIEDIWAGLRHKELSNTFLVQK